MSGRETWRLAAVLVVMTLAVLFTLDIDFPAWVEDLRFWAEPGRGAIAIHSGMDLEGGLQVIAATSADGEQPSLDALEETGRVLTDRLEALEVMAPVVRVLEGGKLAVELSGIRERRWVTVTIETFGLVELIDAGLRQLPAGYAVQTSLGLTEQQTDPITATDPTTLQQPAEPIYETVLSSADLDYVELVKTKQSGYSLSFRTTEAARPGFAAFTGANIGSNLCLAIDKRVYSCPAIQTVLDGGGGVPIPVAEVDAPFIGAILSTGPLPEPLRIESSAELGPTLGDAGVESLARAGAFGLAALSLFLMAHYRLAGLVTDLLLVCYGLIAYSLSKLIPVPFTLPALAGFVAASFAAAGGLCILLERLREAKRLHGRLSARDFDGAFSAAWPSVRNAHAALLALGAAFWYVGNAADASAIGILGHSLLFSALAGLFMATHAARTLVRLTLRQAREPLSGSTWLLGV